MTNDQAAMTNQVLMTNAQVPRDGPLGQLVVRSWSLIGHWGLVIGHSA
jgi:hypothetical protein